MKRRLCIQVSSSLSCMNKFNINTVDDGTGVVDCNHAHRPQKSSPKRTSSGQSAVDPPQLPNPIAIIGKTICVIGRVRNVYESRAIFVDHMSTQLVLPVCKQTNLHNRHMYLSQ